MIRPVSEQQQYPLNENQTVALLGLMMNSTPGSDPALEHALSQDTMGQLIQRRAAYHGVIVTAPLVAYVALVSEGVPGRAVQLLHALAVNTHVDETVGLDHFCHIFHTGLPNDQGFIAAWDAQKDEKGKNLLDTTAWERRK